MALSMTWWAIARAIRSTSIGSRRWERMLRREVRRR
jgi:hypothetical protein